jgi:hypothetical protein
MLFRCSLSRGGTTNCAHFAATRAQAPKRAHLVAQMGVDLYKVRGSRRKRREACTNALDGLDGKPQLASRASPGQREPPVQMLRQPNASDQRSHRHTGHTLRRKHLRSANCGAVGLHPTLKRRAVRAKLREGTQAPPRSVARGSRLRDWGRATRAAFVVAALRPRALLALGAASPNRRRG